MTFWLLYSVGLVSPLWMPSVTIGSAVLLAAVLNLTVAGDERGRW